MGDKYIIKNCPATGAGCCGDTCSEITDCPLKQIVEKCKIDIQNYSYYDKDYALGRTTEAKRILKLLDIQEILE